MNGTPTIYCSTCHTLRAVHQWHDDHHESFLIELEPCGHVMVRNARIEWRAHGAAA